MLEGLVSAPHKVLIAQAEASRTEVLQHSAFRFFVVSNKKMVYEKSFSLNLLILQKCVCPEICASKDSRAWCSVST